MVISWGKKKVTQLRASKHWQIYTVKTSICIGKMFRKCNQSHTLRIFLFSEDPHLHRTCKRRRKKNENTDVLRAALLEISVMCLSTAAQTHHRAFGLISIYSLYKCAQHQRKRWAGESRGMVLVTSKAHTVSACCMVFYRNNICCWMLPFYITHTPPLTPITRRQHSKWSAHLTEKM